MMQTVSEEGTRTARLGHLSTLLSAQDKEQNDGDDQNQQSDQQHDALGYDGTNVRVILNR